MKKFLLIITLFCSTLLVEAQNNITSDTQLALKYYRAKDYDKAIPLLERVYKKTRSSYYYQLYTLSLIETNQYDKAIASSQKELKKAPTKIDLYVTWGYILSKQNKNDAADKKYKMALDKVQKSRGGYINLGNNFIRWGQFEWAKKTYLQAQEQMPEQSFSYELALAYFYLHDYKRMMDGYLDLIKKDNKKIGIIQSRLSSTMRLDFDDELRDQLRKKVLKRIQQEPNESIFNRLLIWFFLQENKFSSALKQSIALDKRTGKEDAQIYRLAQMAAKNKQYENANKAYRYILENKPKSNLYNDARINLLLTDYAALGSDSNKEKATQLSNEMQIVIDSIGYSTKSIGLIKTHAHLLAFHLNKFEKAVEILKKGLKISNLKTKNRGILKSELADIYAYSNAPWEATLIYSQVIEDNKKSSLGDETKLKKAKLSYYMGNFEWAKAQLDVLKASTSKLTANDAMDLSILISNSLSIDTTGMPLRMFSRADFLFFKNKNREALSTLDSLISLNTYDLLVDDILFRKANIEINKKAYSKAAEHLEKICTDFSFESLGDDAHYQLAELYHYQLNQPEKAKGIYKAVFVNYPGSVFAEEARTKYRKLLERYPDKEEQLKASEENVTE